jgi:hypothetical protein
MVLAKFACSKAFFQCSSPVMLVEVRAELFKTIAKRAEELE